MGTHLTSLRNSLLYASVAAVACGLFAIFLAYIVQRKEWRGRNLVGFLAIAPAAVPGIFFGIGYATAFNQSWLNWLDRGALITLSMVFWNLPIGYGAAVAGLQQIDRSIDDAARSLGASSLQAFRQVLLPMLGGSLATGMTTTFVRAITTLSVVIFLFTPTSVVSTVTIFQLVNDFDWGGATAFTVTVIGLAIAVVVLFSRLTGRRVRVEVGGV